MDATNIAYSGTCYQCDTTFTASSMEAVVLLLAAHERAHWEKPLQEHVRVLRSLLRRARPSVELEEGCNLEIDDDAWREQYALLAEIDAELEASDAC